MKHRLFINFLTSNLLAINYPMIFKILIAASENQSKEAFESKVLKAAKNRFTFSFDNAHKTFKVNYSDIHLKCPLFHIFNLPFQQLIYFLFMSLPFLL